MRKQPHLKEGTALRNARAGRPVSEIVRDLTYPSTGKEVKVGHYQNWERGMNAPKREIWGPLGKRLGLDVQALYMKMEGGKPPDRAVRSDAVLPLIRSIRRDLDVLEKMIVPGVSDEHIKRSPAMQGGRTKKKQRSPSA
jgi:hypothetical protein